VKAIVSTVPRLISNPLIWAMNTEATAS
jgi:hypothetical protein